MLLLIRSGIPKLALAVGFLLRAAFGSFPKVASLALLLFSAVDAQAELTLKNLNPPGRTDTNKTSLTVILTGTGFTQQSRITFDPARIKATVLSVDATTLTATFTISSDATGLINVTVSNNQDGTFSSPPLPFDTGVVCLDAVTSGCALRWEVVASSATGSSTQTGNTTAPNILFKLDYQLRNSKDPEDLTNARNSLAIHGTPTKLPPRGFSNRFVMHAIFETGYTQVSTASKLQPATNATSTTTSGNTTSSSVPCSGTSAASGAPASTTSTTASGCTAAIQQQAFVAEAGGTLGWTIMQDGQGTFAEFGLGVRGSFQDIVQSNQIVQSGGVSYIDLASANPRNAVGLYEAVGRFRLAALGHDAPTAATGPKTGSYTHNVSDFLVIEAGYQNNSGLQQLAANPQTNTRNRLVGRFYAYPEISSTNHTKILVGMEYSGGIGGGPKVIQIFFGANINPLKLFKPSTGTEAAQ